MDRENQWIIEVLNDKLIHMILSNTRDAAKASKVKIRPVLLKEGLMFQETLYLGQKVFHENFSAEEMSERIEKYLQEQFRQLQCVTADREITVLVSKKGKRTLKTRVLRADGDRPLPAPGALEHNRQKQYVLQDGEPVGFLIGLGVQTPDGHIVKARYDKFRQINRYLEFIEDILDDLPKDRTIRIIDFGCGKSYLTFAMYYYLHVQQKRDIQVTGLDLKEDVIRHCNELAGKLGYNALRFETGDISTYEGADAVDMVVSLHACDTATDYALYKAVNWGASVILAVPCCQHEINGQIQNSQLAPILRYGLLKERFSAIVTDALRANLLEQQGYRTQILEFIDMEHTPKNLLIRAVKQKGMQPRKNREAVQNLEEFLNLSPTLEKLLQE